MTAPFSARRRADEFEALLSRDPTTATSGRDAEPYADLLDVVADLRAVPPVTARPEFVASLRERLWSTSGISPSCSVASPRAGMWRESSSPGPAAGQRRR